MQNTKTAKLERIPRDPEQYVRTISTFIWKDNQFRDLGAMEKLVLLHILTSDNMNLFGFSFYPIEGIAPVIHCSAEEARNAVHTLESLGIIKYDSANCVLLVPKYLEYNPFLLFENLANKSKKSFLENRKNQLNDIISSMPATPLIKDFMAVYKKYLCVNVSGDLDEESVSRYESYMMSLACVREGIQMAEQTTGMEDTGDILELFSLEDYVKPSISTVAPPSSPQPQPQLPLQHEEQPAGAGNPPTNANTKSKRGRKKKDPTEGMLPEEIAIYNARKEKQDRIYLEMWEGYPNKDFPSRTRDIFDKLIKSGEFKAEDILESTKNYLYEMGKKGTGKKYYFALRNFLHEKYFVEFLPENYNTGEPREEEEDDGFYHGEDFLALIEGNNAIPLS